MLRDAEFIGGLRDRAEGFGALRHRLFRQGGVDPGFHHLGGAEADHAPRIDRGRFAGLGVAAHAGAFGAHLEDAESGKLDLFALFQGLDDEFERALDEPGAVLPRQADFLVNGLTQIRACQSLSLHGPSPSTVIPM